MRTWRSGFAIGVALAVATAATRATPPPRVTTRTYQDGTRLYLEQTDGRDVRRIGLETDWGGAIAEASLNGLNFVNEHDTGRLIQLSLYDGNQHYSKLHHQATWGWNPVEGGDLYKHGNPTLASELKKDSLYAKARGIEWSPDGKGGGPTRPVPSDVFFEKWISTVPSHPGVFRVRYRIAHAGSDSHAGTRQELPATYVNAALGTLDYYGGLEPFRNRAVTATTDPSCKVSGGTIYSPERWGAFAKGEDQGLTLFVPGAYPYFVACHLVDDGTTGPTGNSTNYLQPVVSRGFAPREVFESEFYVAVAAPEAARSAIYDLQRAVPESDTLSPFGALDSPAPESTIGGVATVRGWMLDNVQVTGVRVLVDDVFAGQATLGTPRPDVVRAFPNAPTTLGFAYSLDTKRYAPGSHVVKVVATDAAGNTAGRSAAVIIVKRP